MNIKQKKLKIEPRIKLNYTSQTPVFLNFEYQLEMKDHQYHSTLKLANLINPSDTFCIDTT